MAIDVNPIIWRDNRPLDGDEFQQVVDKIKSDDSLSDVEWGRSVVKSSFLCKKQQDRPDYVFKDFYVDVITDVVRDLNLQSERIDINFWCQVYDGRHSQHDHFNPLDLLAFVHFVRPLEEKKFHFVGLDGKKDYPKQEPGDIIVFPSWVRHAVDESYGNERAVIAGNIMFPQLVTAAATFERTKIRRGLDVIERFEHPNTKQY